MKNDYNYWDKYLKKVIDNIQTLMTKKDKIYIDLHIHSNYSADSDVSLEEIIDRSRSNHLDIISITDHDSIKVYNELFEYLKINTLDDLIIIPGVEFTIDNEKYGSQFHVVQTMINPKEEELNKNILHQEEAMWLRAKKQFERLHTNKVFSSYFEKYNFDCNVFEYKKFLQGYYKQIPEYYTIMKYIQKEFNNHQIFNWKILAELQELNKQDKCIERQKIKEKEYKRLIEKYKDVENSDKNSRMFHCLLAVRGADDDYFENYDNMGDLSVNNFGELKFHELNKKHFTILAHPSEDKIYLLGELIKENDNLRGLEYNMRNKYNNDNTFYDYQLKYNLIKTIGSDIHDLQSNLYNCMENYLIDKTSLSKYIECAKKYVYKYN